MTVKELGSASRFGSCGSKMSSVCRWAYILGLVLFVGGCGGFYLPGSYMHTYSNGDPIFGKGSGIEIIGTGVEGIVFVIFLRTVRRDLTSYEELDKESQAQMKKELSGIVFVIFLRTVRRDLTSYEELDKESQAQMKKELSGWKLVGGDEFREPECVKLICVMVRDGVQILGMAAVTIVFSALGFMSPASLGLLLTGMIILYLFLGIASGYVGVRARRTIKGTSEGWRSISWSVACFFPGIVFVILTVLNFLIWGSNSTNAIPISLHFILFALWFCMSVPLTLLGGFLSTKAEEIQYPVRTNQITREIPACKYSSWLLVLGAGTLPFGTLFIELFFILSSIWLGRFYYVFGFLLILHSSLPAGRRLRRSLSCPYVHASLRGGLAMVVEGLLCFRVGLALRIPVLHQLPGLRPPEPEHGFVSTMLYLGYSLIMSVAIMLSTGTIGLLTSFYFVHYPFSSVKID
ncbi:hypothetical protein MLD38_021565 [Melastoma candidum]|uniref:Uncharacterized protein n=1 Tax=Melastoma candidum TaxID=119954 RepID=A0ACB9QGN3_9MYRT|nr:hypothetical protein MLD38_021565 [Melastoma candidum]